MLDADAHERVLEWLADSDFPFAVRTIAAPTYRRVLAQRARPAGPPVNDGNGFVFVSHLGDVCPSGFLQLPVGNLRDAPLRAWYRESALFRSLRDPDALIGADDTLPLSILDESRPEGEAIGNAARRTLRDLGRGAEQSITLAEALGAADLLAAQPLNGDGIVTPGSAPGPVGLPLQRLTLPPVTGVSTRLPSSSR